MIARNLLPGEKIVKSGVFRSSYKKVVGAIILGIMVGFLAFLGVVVATFNFSHIDLGMPTCVGIISGIIVMKLILNKSEQKDEFAITNKRVFAYTLPRIGYDAQSGVFSRSSYVLTSLEISKVETISITEDGINVIGTGGTMLYASRLENACELKDYLQKVVDECRVKIDMSSSVAFANVNPTPVSQTSQPSSGSNLEKLRELKDMLDMGLISESEYEEKKKQILTNL